MPRGSIRGYIACAIAVLFVAYKPRNRTEQQHATRTTKRNEDSKIEVVSQKILSLPLIEVRTHPDERKYQKERDKYNWVQPALLVFTGLAAFFSAWAASQASRQATAADEANRPWLYVERIDVSKLENFDGNIKVSADVYIKNIGHTVANSIHVAVDVALPQELDFIRAERYCSHVEIDQFESAGKVAFPDKTVVASGVTQPFKDIYRGENSLVLLACAVYRKTNDSFTHKTGTVFLIKNINSKSAGVFKDVATVNDYYEGGYAK